MVRSNKYEASTGLRTKYFPKNRIGHGLISAAPWLNIMLLLICFVILESRFILQQGVVIDLPPSSFKGMIHAELVLVVRSVDGGSQGKKEIIFFDDERFIVSESGQMKSLKASFVRHVGKDNDSGALIYADGDVRQGTLVNIFNMVRDAGVVKINIASRPEAKL